MKKPRPAPAVPRARLSAEERKLQILRAATQVFARSNYRLSGTAEIALEAGVAEPTIYKYFPSKKALFIGILAKTADRILEIWGKIADDESDALAALARIGTAYFEGVQTHALELKIQFQALAESDEPDIARQLKQNHSAYIKFLSTLVERGKKQGVVRPQVDAYAAGWFLNGIGFTLTMARLLDLGENARGHRLKKMILSYLDWIGAPDTLR